MTDFDAIIFHAFSQSEADALTRAAHDGYVTLGIACYIGFTYGKGESLTQAGPDGRI